MVNRGFILNMLEPKFIGHGLLLNLELYIEMRCNSSYNPALHPVPTKILSITKFMLIKYT
jgi:hypothetical protein